MEYYLEAQRQYSVELDRLCETAETSANII